MGANFNVSRSYKGQTGGGGGLFTPHPYWIGIKIAKELKTETFPSIIRFVIRHSLRAFSIFTEMALKIRFLIQFQEICAPSTFTVFVIRSRHFKAQSAIFTPFSVQCTNTDYFTFYYVRFQSGIQRKYLELMENI